VPAGIYIEEQGVYQIDCSRAVWSTDQVHSDYRNAGTFLSDADFIAETDDYIYIVEYKNATISSQAESSGFDPTEQRIVDKIAKKFYDSLHYIRIHNKNKPVKYVFIVEYPAAGVLEREELCDIIWDRLPFALQTGKPAKIIEDFEVVSIAEWNEHPEYSQFPFSPVPTRSVGNQRKKKP